MKLLQTQKSNVVNSWSITFELKKSKEIVLALLFLGGPNVSSEAYPVGFLQDGLDVGNMLVISLLK